jgi:hypothetical protein
MDGFLNPILPKGVPLGEFSEFREVIKSLAFFDSIHDFWPERKTKSAIEEADDDDFIDMPADRIDAVHKTLEDDGATYLGTSPTTIDVLLKTTTNGAISSVSDIENRVMKYFSMKYAPFNTAEVKMTFDEILQNWRFNNDWNAYSAKILLLSDVVEIVGNGRSVKSLTDEERGILGFFILAYMDPTKQPGTDNTDVGFTFDMAPRDIGKIFARFKKVYNDIYPQNIADSASTSFSSLQGRNRFFKADGTLGGPTVGAPLIVRSNLFTWNTHTIEFIDQGFGPENKFGFQISITDNNTGAKHVLQFRKGQEQGPPVNYLMDMIASQRIQGEVPKISTAVRLPPALPFNSRLLFDLKRMGDHEQMRVDNAYGVTGDRLAAVYRRALRKPGIYHSFSGIRLFRSLSGLADPQELALRNEKFKCEEVFGKITLLTGYQSDYDSAASDLNRMKQQVYMGMQSGSVLMAPINLQGADFATKYTEIAATKYTEIAATFTTYFLRYRMKDILKHIDTLQTKLASIPIAQLAQLAQSLSQSINTATVTTDLTQIRSEREALETFLETVEELRKMKIVFNSNGVREPIYVELFQANGRLKKGVRSDIFNFASGPYLHNETGMQVAVARILVHKRSKRLDSIKSTLYENLSLYLAARDAAKEAFFDPEMLDTIESASDIPNGLTLEQLVGPEGIDRAIIGVVGLSAQTGGNGTSDNTPKKQGPKQESSDIKLRTAEKQLSQQSSRDSRRRESIDRKRFPPILQYRDIHDLFIEICLDAQQGEDLTSIEVKWVLGINDIRAQSMDEYKQPFEESDATDIITFLLSWRNPPYDFTPIFQLPEGEDVLYGDLERKTKGTVAIIEYVRGALLTTQNREGLIYAILDAFAKELEKDPSLFQAPGSDGLNTQWSGIPTRLQQLLIEKTRYIMGGGRRPLYQEQIQTAGRRPLYG